jgi:hypothetical protein
VSRTYCTVRYTDAQVRDAEVARIYRIDKDVAGTGTVERYTVQYTRSQDG